MFFCSDSLNFVNKNKNETYFVGLSGGVDSVVLLSALVELGVKCHALHVNHGISANSDEWERHCMQLCKQIGVPISVTNLNLNKRLPNLECVARNERYSFFEKIAGKNGIVVTAHHMNDQVETFLLAAKRGSGVDGLSAMPLIKSGNSDHFRPMLSKTKSEILRYAHEKGLSWVEDESNLSSDYDRNFLRNEVIPLLESRWKGFSTSISRTVQMCSLSRAALSELVTEKYQSCLSSRKMLSVDKVKSIGGYAVYTFIIREWLRDNGLTYLPSEKIIRQICTQFLGGDQPKSTAIVVVHKDLCVRYYNGHMMIAPTKIENGYAFQCLAISLNVNVSEISDRAKVWSGLNPVRVSVRGKSWNLNDYLHHLGVEPWLRGFVPTEIEGEKLIWPIGD